MSQQEHFTSIHFKNFKSFKDYWVSLQDFNVLVGPNNSGKSTILAAFRILAEGIRRARSKNPSLIQGPNHKSWGYFVPLSEVPIATENIFTDYDDSEPAFVKFRISNKNELHLFFPQHGTCYLICESQSSVIKSTVQFKKEYNVSIGFVPILGPVEHNEQLYLKEAARLALLTHRASRNFRNIWYHYPEYFDEFRELVKFTWSGMDIEKPEVDISPKKARLHMFCPEGRIPREIYWTGFGFQVWCQMLTFIVNNKGSTIFIIDEPDIYLHSDLQRQLIGILKNLGPDILMATHSVEMISEADPDDLLVVNKNQRSAKRIKDPTQLQEIFNVLGSNLNSTLTQLAKTKRALFVEGKDYQILSKFARKLNKIEVANKSDFTVIPVEGFNPKKLKDFIKGIEITLGSRIVTAVIFDRDYRSDAEIKKQLSELNKFNKLSHIHSRKEIENYLLEVDPIRKAIKRKINDYNKRSIRSLKFREDILVILKNITDPLKHKIAAQLITARTPFEKSINPGVHDSTIHETLMKEFESRWEDVLYRLSIVPGKMILSALNKYLQENYNITLTAFVIIACCKKDEIPAEIVDLIGLIDDFRYMTPD